MSNMQEIGALGWQFRNLLSSIILVVVFLAFSASIFAQNPVSWKLENDASGKSLKAGDKFKAKLSAEIEGDWHLYSTAQEAGGPIPTTIKSGDNFKLGKISENPPPIQRLDPAFNIETKFFGKSARFEIPVEAAGEVKADDLQLSVRYQVCNDTLCLPPKTVKVGLAGIIEEAKPQSSKPAFTPEKPQDQSLWAFLWLAVTFGAISLLTPCVFPMIPITVSYFTNHASGNRSKSVKLALVYSLGIIATFTLLGMALAALLGASGINQFAANPFINILITSIFLFFAFNLFGFYEITIPPSILSKMDAITRSKEGSGSAYIGALLMGLTFTMTSFTCTSPFIGTILVSTAQGDWQWPMLGMLAFSTVFALPFFILALAPQLVSQLPKAGGWLNSVKVLMGFLEIAAALKFLSNVDLVWHWGIFTREVVLIVWVLVAIGMAAYILGLFKFSHDSPVKKIGALRIILSLAVLGLGVYLTTGILGKKLGELESFLPPKDANSAFNVLGNKDEDLAWMKNDLDGALKKAKAENRLVFIDFTGYTCTNCRWMETNMFPLPEVKAELDKYVLVSLYTDGEGEIYEKYQKYQEETFGTVALPYYAIMDPDGKPLATFPGLTRSKDEFINFLRRSEK